MTAKEKCKLMDRYFRHILRYDESHTWFCTEAALNEQLTRVFGWAWWTCPFSRQFISGMVYDIPQPPYDKNVSAWWLLRWYDRL